MRLAAAGGLDTSLEYLAELTMSLAVQKAKDASAGYATDFIDVLVRLAHILNGQPSSDRHQRGMNPHACATRQPTSDSRVAVVSGDDLMPRLDELIASGHTLNHLDTGQSLIAIRDKVVSATPASAKPIVDASNSVRESSLPAASWSSLTVGPAAFEFGWGFGEGDLDRLRGRGRGAPHQCGAGDRWPVDQHGRVHALGDVVSHRGDVRSSAFTSTKPRALAAR